MRIYYFKSILPILIFIFCYIHLFATPPMIISTNPKNEVSKKELDQQGIPFSKKAFFDAIKKNDITTVELFLNSGMNINSLDDNGFASPLMVACTSKQTTMVNYLLGKGADINVKGIGDWTVLMRAAEAGLLDVVRILLDKGVDVNEKTNYGMTALIIAAQNGNIETVNILLEKNPDLKAKTDYGRTALHSAALNGHSEIVKILLEKGAEIDIKNSRRMTPLMEAAWQGQTESVQLLLKYGAKIDTTDQGDTNNTLTIAAQEGHTDIVKLLIEHGANVKFNNERAFLLAVSNGHTGTVKTLLEHGSNINLTDDWIGPVWKWAAKNGHLNIVYYLKNSGATIYTGDMNEDFINAEAIGDIDQLEILLDKGANINAQSKSREGWSAIHWAVARGDKARVRELVKLGAIINLPTKEGQTALMLAAEKNDFELIDWLIKMKADMTLKDSIRGRTALMYAAFKGNREAVHQLSGSSEIVNIKSKDGWTALLDATWGNHFEIAHELIHRGAEVNIQISDGRTPLICAVMNNNPVMVKYLLEKGAKIDVKNQEGKTALMIAKERNLKEIERLLESYK